MDLRSGDNHSCLAALFEQTKDVPEIKEAMMILAQRGLEAPDALTPEQVKQVCFVAVAHLRLCLKE